MNSDPFELVQQTLELVPKGIQHYRNGEFDSAIQVLSAALDFDSINWEARLYLAMALCKTGKLYLARIHFVALGEKCPLPIYKKRVERFVTAIDTAILQPRLGSRTSAAS